MKKSPRALDGKGRIVGDTLFVLHEVPVYLWQDKAPYISAFVYCRWRDGGIHLGCWQNLGEVVLLARFRGIPRKEQI